MAVVYFIFAALVPSIYTSGNATKKKQEKQKITFRELIVRGGGGLLSVKSCFSLLARCVDKKLKGEKIKNNNKDIATRERVGKVERADKLKHVEWCGYGQEGGGGGVALAAVESPRA